MDKEQIIKKNTRFTMLSPGLVRMEYSPDGQFEDRRSIRALTRPEGVPFAKFAENGVNFSLDTGEMLIEFVADGKPFSKSNLCVKDAKTGKEFWNPGTVDEENLGGVHVSMDYVKPGMIPQGVHPASIEHHENGGDLILWSFMSRLNSEPGAMVGDGANLATKFDEILATRDFESLPQAVKDLMLERWKYPPGILSKSGFFLYNDTPSPVMDPKTEWVVERPDNPGYMDLYLFYYRQDFKRALKDYRTLFGATPLPPKYALGLWYSRYPTFNEQEVYELVEKFAEHDLPIDMFVFDLEWHQRGWHGFDWDNKHFPNPDKLLQFLKEKDIHTTFNVHPGCVHSEDKDFDKFLEATGIECDKSAIEPDFRGDLTFGDFDTSIPAHAEAFMDIFHKPVQDQGVDFWWIDGSCPVKEVKGLDRQLWTNHIYHEHIKKNYQDRRPMIFSREPGFGAHRYPFHFTADTWSYWETLENQVEQTLRAGHIGQSYVTHDIGGHISSALHIDPELYMRWVQFAVLSPIIRLHSSKQGEGIGGERRPWMYGERVVDSFKKAIDLRMSLIPYLYSLFWQSHAEGLPICRSSCLEMPEWQEGYQEWSSYFIGDRIFATPVLTPGTVREVLLPPGKWYHALTGELIESDGKTSRTEVSPFDDIPLHYFRAGSIMIKQNPPERAGIIPENLILEIYPDEGDWSDSFTLYEDDGVTPEHQQSEFTTQEFHVEQKGKVLTLTIDAKNRDFINSPECRNYQIKVIGKEIVETFGKADKMGEISEGEFVTVKLPLNKQYEIKVSIK